MRAGAVGFELGVHLELGDVEAAGEVAICGTKSACSSRGTGRLIAIR